MAPSLPPELKDNHPEFTAVTWKDQTIILSYTARAVIKAYCHKDGKWSLKKTRGDEPMFWTGSSATVHNDTMLLMGGLTLGKVSSNDIYALDLHSWQWTKLGPKGNPPLGCHHLTTWMYDGKMYGFGGKASVQYINQLFCYNIADNSWEWPFTRGKIPCPRAAHTTFICSDTVFIFGGWENGNKMNDLYTLDMVGMTWTQVHPSLIGTEGESLPKRRVGHSMTLVSSKAAVLFSGGIDHDPHGDIWLLNIGKVLRGDIKSPSSLWERCEQHEQSLSASGAKRIFHSAVVEPISKRLWIMGGLQKDRATELRYLYPKRTTEVLSLPFNSGASLKFLAMESALRHFSPGHPMLEETEIPRHLKIELENHFQHLSINEKQ